MRLVLGLWRSRLRPIKILFFSRKQRGRRFGCALIRVSQGWGNAFREFQLKRLDIHPLLLLLFIIREEKSEPRNRGQEEESEEVMSLLTLHGQSALHATNSAERRRQRTSSSSLLALGSASLFSQEATN
jgi:hypothetical protein